MTCQQAHQELKAYLDGELPLFDRWIVSCHLRTCAVCQDEMTSLEHIGRTVKTLKDAGAPSAAFREEIMARFRAERSQIMNPHKASASSARRTRVRWQPVGAAIAALLVVWALGNTLVQQSWHKRGMPQEANKSPMMAKMMAKMGGPASPGALDTESYPVGAKMQMPAGGRMMGGAPPTAARSAEEARATSASPTTSRIAYAGRKIIQTADITLEVESFQGAYEQVVSIARKYGGFVADSYSQVDAEGYRQGNITIRVPGEAFEKAVKEIYGLGEVITQQIQGRDVTDEYVDTQARIRNLRRTEERFLAILKRMTRLDDILRMEQEITRVRGEIEQMQAHLINLERQSALVTVSVAIQQKREVPLPKRSSWSFWNIVREAINSLLETGKEAISSLMFLVKGIMTVLIWVAVYIPFWGAALLLFLLYRNKKRMEEKARGSESQERVESAETQQTSTP